MTRWGLAMLVFPEASSVISKQVDLKSSNRSKLSQAWAMGHLAAATAAAGRLAVSVFHRDS